MGISLSLYVFLSLPLHVPLVPSLTSVFIISSPPFCPPTPLALREAVQAHGVFLATSEVDKEREHVEGGERCSTLLEIDRALEEGGDPNGQGGDGMHGPLHIAALYNATDVSITGMPRLLRGTTNGKIHSGAVYGVVADFSR
jgi:hypothetical protein